MLNLVFLHLGYHIQRVMDVTIVFINILWGVSPNGDIIVTFVTCLLAQFNLILMLFGYINWCKSPNLDGVTQPYSM
jgi:hypothetical protein